MHRIEQEKVELIEVLVAMVIFVIATFLLSLYTFSWVFL